MTTNANTQKTEVSKEMKAYMLKSGFLPDTAGLKLFNNKHKPICLHTTFTSDFKRAMKFRLWSKW